MKGSEASFGSSATARIDANRTSRPAEIVGERTGAEERATRARSASSARLDPGSSRGRRRIVGHVLGCQHALAERDPPSAVLGEHDPGRHRGARHQPDDGIELGPERDRAVDLGALAGDAHRAEREVAHDRELRVARRSSRLATAVPPSRSPRAARTRSGSRPRPRRAGTRAPRRWGSRPGRSASRMTPAPRPEPATTSRASRRARSESRAGSLGWRSWRARRRRRRRRPAGLRHRSRRRARELPTHSERGASGAPVAGSHPVVRGCGRVG